MAKSLEDENRELKEKNSALVKKVQHWKMTAAQREDEKLDLMKELNHLRLSMSHYRSSGAALDAALDSAVQDFGKHSLTRLVEVSTDITRTVELMKTYIRKKQELERMSASGKQSVRESPRDRSSKVLRVVPMIRGRSIVKPIILLRPIDATAHAMRQARNANRADPDPPEHEEEEAEDEQEEVRTPTQHILQDVYIPLRRIDADVTNSVNTRGRPRPEPMSEDAADDADDSMESNDLELDEDGEEGSGDDMEDEGQGEEVESEREEDYNAMRTMDPLPEDAEDENWSPQVMLSRRLPTERSYADNPLEGPSWLLDGRYRETTGEGGPVPPTPASSPLSNILNGGALEPDSTTDANRTTPGAAASAPASATASAPAATATTPTASTSRSATFTQVITESPTARVFTPTRRARRKRSLLSSPCVSLELLDEVWPRPVPPTRRDSVRHNHKDPTKVLVMVAKMRMEELPARSRRCDDVTPLKRIRTSLEAPSPNGSTQDAGLIVMDSAEEENSSHLRSERQGSVQERSEWQGSAHGILIHERSERLGSMQGRTEQLGSVHGRPERQGSVKLERQESVEERSERQGSAQGISERQGSAQGRSERQGSVQGRSERQGSVQGRSERQGSVRLDRQESVQERSERQGSAQGISERQGSVQGRSERQGSVQGRSERQGSLRLERQESVQERSERQGSVQGRSERQGSVQERSERQGSVRLEGQELMEERSERQESAQGISEWQGSVQGRSERQGSVQGRSERQGSVRLERQELMEERSEQQVSERQGSVQGSELQVSVYERSEREASVTIRSRRQRSKREGSVRERSERERLARKESVHERSEQETSQRFGRERSAREGSVDDELPASSRGSSEESEEETAGTRAKRSRRGPTSYKEKPLNRKLRR